MIPRPLKANLFKKAVAVAKLTAFGRKDNMVVALEVPGMNGFNTLTHFHTVGANVLNGCSAHRSRNKRQVFQATQPMGKGPHDKVVPVLPTCTAQSAKPLACGKPNNPLEA